MNGHMPILNHHDPAKNWDCDEVRKEAEKQGKKEAEKQKGK